DRGMGLAHGGIRPDVAGGGDEAAGRRRRDQRGVALERGIDIDADFEIELALVHVAVDHDVVAAVGEAAFAYEVPDGRSADPAAERLAHRPLADDGERVRRDFADLDSVAQLSPPEGPLTRCFAATSPPRE